MRLGDTQVLRAVGAGGEGPEFGVVENEWDEVVGELAGKEGGDLDCGRDGGWWSWQR